MSDKELLELAAKAAGIELRPIAIKPASGEGDGFIGYMADVAVWPRGWFDPLTDDGDALRLAAKLKITIAQPDDPGDADEVGAWTGKTYIWVKRGDDPCAATRRAIVRAAAAIGAAQ